jgi:hypothetical protein
VSDPKQRALEKLDEMVDDAISVLNRSITGTLIRERGSTRTADARWLLEVVLERLPSADKPKPTENAEGVTPADDLATRRDALQKALRLKRAEK